MVKYIFCVTKLFGILCFALSYSHSKHANVESYFPELLIVLQNLEEKSPLLLEQNQLIREQIGNQIVANSAKGLKLSINLTTQSIHEDRPDQSFYHKHRSFGSIYARKPLFHWGALQAESHIANQRTEIAKLSYKESILDLSSQARHSYLDLFLLQKKKELKEESLVLDQESLSRQVRQKQLGLSSELDVSESNASLLENEILLADLNQSLSNSINQFKSITGWEGNLSFEDQDALFDNFIFEKVFKKEMPSMIAGISSKTMDRLEREIEIEKNQLIIAKSQLKPKLNLVGGFYQDQVALANSEANLLRNNIIIGLEANWAIWDSSKSKGQKSASLARKRRLEYALDRELKSFRIYIENLRQNLFSLANRIEMSTELLEVAKSRFKTSRIEFNANRIAQTGIWNLKLHLIRQK